MNRTALAREVLRTQIQIAAIQMDLRATQCTLLKLMHLLDPAQSRAWREAFVERRRELIERTLIRFESLDPALTAEIQESMEDDFSDWAQSGQTGE